MSPEPETRRAVVQCQAKPSQTGSERDQASQIVQTGWLVVQMLQLILGVSNGLQRGFDFVQNGRIINGRGHFKVFAVGDLNHGRAQNFT